LADKNGLAKAFYFRGLAYRGTQKVEEAISDYTQVIKRREELKKQEKLADRNDLAKAFYNRGWSYNRIQKYEEEIADYTQTIKIWK